MRHTRSLTILAVLALFAAAVAPAAAADATLVASVEQDPATGNATVTITNGTAPVENATVTVTSDAAYDGNGTFVTDADGTVGLPAPSESVTINVTAVSDGLETTTEVELRTRQDAFDASLEQADEGSVSVAVTLYGEAVENATVNVTANGSYAGNGTYATDANGTVSLAQPEDARDVTVEAAYDGLAAETTASLVGSNALNVSLAQDGADVTVTVARNGTGVENATVNVTADVAYDGNGSYVTDANGTVGLSAPAENATLEITASEGGDEVTESFDVRGVVPSLGVSVDQRSDGVIVEVARGDAGVGNATVEVSADGNYSGEGTYETDTDGTLNLPFPSENVTVTVTAEHDGDTAAATADLTTEFVGETRNFGQAVRLFIELLETGDFEGAWGHAVSDFVTQNNPGKADDAPGRAGGENASEEAKDGRQNGKAAGNGDKERGPPAHAKGHSGEGDADRGDSKEDADRGNADRKDSKDSDREDSDDADDDTRGPPDRAGGNNGNGKGK